MHYNSYQFLHDSISFSSSSFFISWNERITVSFSLVLKDVALSDSWIFTPVRRNTYEFSFKRFNAIYSFESFWSFLSICFKWVRTSIARSFLLMNLHEVWILCHYNVIITAARCSSMSGNIVLLSVLYFSCWIWWFTLFMLLYRSFKASFLVSAGKERFESSFRTESKKNLIFLFVLFRYEMRLTVRKTRVRIQIIEKRREWSIIGKISQDGRKQHY